MQSLPVAVRAAAISLCLVTFASSSRADTVYLKNGAYIDGLVTARSETLLTITIGQIGKLEVSMEDVVRVEKNSRTGSRVYAPVDRRELPDMVRKRNEPAGSGASGEADGSGKDGEGDADSEAEGGNEDGEEQKGGDEDSQGEGDGKEISPKLKAEIEKLVADLQRQKTKHRRRAERRLDKIGAPAVPFLLPLATRGGDLTRITALRLVYAHARESDPEIVDVCIKALKDDNYFVRDYAVKTLRRLTDQDFEFDPKAGARSRSRALANWEKWWEKEKEKTEEADDDDDDDDGRDTRKEEVDREEVGEEKADVGEDDEDDEDEADVDEADVGEDDVGEDDEGEADVDN